MLANRKHYFVLLILWLVVEAGLFIHNGIVTNGEAIPYIAEANYFIANAAFTSAKSIFYSVYILLLALFKKTGFQSTGIYVLQVALNLYAMYCFFKLTHFVTKSFNAALLATILLITCIPWQDWTTYLYTESVFCSMVIIFSYSIFYSKNNGKKNIFLMVLSFLVLLFSRPTGLLFIPVVGLMLIYYYNKKKNFYGASLSLLTAGVFFLILVNYAMRSGGEFDFMKPFRDENILCYLATQTTSSNATIPPDGNSLQGLLHYVLNNPATFTKLAVLKFQSYWGLTRSYYSSTHNALLICFFYPLYFFAAFGVIKLWQTTTVFVLYSLLIFFFFTLSVLVTCDDWSNRFIMPVLPFVILLGAYGISVVVKKLKAVSLKK
ncbi:MAG TPA: hypothetical protein PLP23_01660 [Panacibacter sp.]|nr:hypothetical protein [Panacibacter sp.]